MIFHYNNFLEKYFEYVQICGILLFRLQALYYVFKSQVFNSNFVEAMIFRFSALCPYVMPFERSLSISIVNIVITRNVFKLYTLVYRAYSVVPLCTYIAIYSG